MTMLFRVGRDEQKRYWIVLVEDRLYGEYLGKNEAVLDAIEAAQDACTGGEHAEVWDQEMTLRLY